MSCDDVGCAGSAGRAAVWTARLQQDAAGKSSGLRVWAELLGREGRRAVLKVCWREREGHCQSLCQASLHPQSPSALHAKTGNTPPSLAFAFWIGPCQPVTAYQRIPGLRKMFGKVPDAADWSRALQAVCTRLYILMHEAFSVNWVHNDGMAVASFCLS